MLATPITDPDAWIDAQAATGGAAWAAAHDAERAGHRVSACTHFRRAADAYATALELVAFSSEPERASDLWRRQRDCWERVVDLAPVPGERLAIPYEGTTLPAFFFRAPGVAAGERRPLVVVNRGCDEPTSQAWALGGSAAAERGYHWMTFDGPGQQAALVEQGLTARPDWEHVLTPVVDAMLARADVDPGRLAVIGAGQAGLLVPRALAFEHRFAAAAVGPGIVDLGAPCAARLPRRLRADLQRGDGRAFDDTLRIDELLSPPSPSSSTSTPRRMGCAGALASTSSAPSLSTGSKASWTTCGRRCSCSTPRTTTAGPANRASCTTGCRAPSGSRHIAPRCSTGSTRSCLRSPAPAIAVAPY